MISQFMCDPILWIKKTAMAARPLSGKSRRGNAMLEGTRSARIFFSEIPLDHFSVHAIY